MLPTDEEFYDKLEDPPAMLGNLSWEEVDEILDEFIRAEAINVG